VTLNYWTWGGGYEDATKLWNSTHPDIQVTFSDIPVGNAGGYQKITTALKAGTAPDVAFLEFDTVPAFASQGTLTDVAPYLGSVAMDDFLPSYRQQVAITGEQSMLAVPLGGGPMALIYRKDLFDKNGITVPATWEEFAAAAKKVRSVDPTAALVNFDGGGNANWFAGLASQNAAQWFGSKGDAWTVTLNGDATTQVADYWQTLVSAKEASTLATFSPEWSAALAGGKIWSWPTAVWGAGVIKGSAPDTAGAWAVAPLPTWGVDKPASAAWGGGALAVLNTTKHPCEAAKFAQWMGTDPGALKILNAAIGIYPTTKTLLADPLFGQPDPFFGDQKIFDVFEQASSGLAPFVWGPSMTDTYKAVTDAFGPSLTAGTPSLGDALDSAQVATVDALEKQGFTVTK
jgi:multiple sugar transport system substrate-binding protein